jgi:DNA-binding SARP family transcriptional activator
MLARSELGCRLSWPWLYDRRAVSDLVVCLLGRPEIERDGVSVPPPRGRKVWGVLAYMLLSEQRVPRARLAALMFGGADDPLGALRWELAQVRRSLGLPAVLRGDPLGLELPAGARVDVLALNAGSSDPALVRGELLEDTDPGAGEAFDAWLLVERRRLAGIGEGVLRDAALGRLAAGLPLEGAAFASRALSLSEFDEGLHELLVRCLARGGQLGAARHQANACEVLFRRELGREPDPRVRRAAEQGELRGSPATGDRAAAVGQLRAGLTALAAGAAEPGVACLRMACAEARANGDEGVLARTLAELGVALVHAVRGRDEEGAALLHEALAVAERAGDQTVAGQACRELGYVEVQAGRGAGAGRWLERATALAVTGSERAAVLGVRGMALSDRAHYGPAVKMLSESVATAERCGAIRQAAWSSALLGRALLLRGDLAAAGEALDRSLALVEQDGWVALLPLPEALRAEVALLSGDLERADVLLEHAFSLGCRLGDPCWEALAARAIGLVHEARGELMLALERLRDAVQRAARVSDPYQWVRAYSLDALATVAIATGADDADHVVDELERIAARSDMRELIVRAALHRADRGNRAGIEAARPLAETIDSPALHAAMRAVA